MHTMNKRINIEQNRVFHLEDSMIMYGVYNVDTLEKIIQMVHKINTGGSRLSRTAVKPDSHLARIFVAKFLCIIKLIIVIG